MSSEPHAKHEPVRSTAHIFGHPIHPMIMPFPLVFLIAAGVTDVVFVVSDDQFWARSSTWLLAAGLFTGVAAALVGLVDFVTIERVRNHVSGWVHFIGNGLVLGLALGNWLPRIGDSGSFVEPWGLLLSGVTVGLLVVTGWTGGELAYKHQIGVIDH